MLEAELGDFYQPQAIRNPSKQMAGQHNQESVLWQHLGKNWSWVSFLRTHIRQLFPSIMAIFFVALWSQNKYLMVPSIMFLCSHNLVSIYALTISYLFGKLWNPIRHWHLDFQFHIDFHGTLAVYYSNAWKPSFVKIWQRHCT